VQAVAFKMCAQEVLKSTVSKTHVQREPGAVLLVVCHEDMVHDRADQAHQNGAHVAEEVGGVAGPHLQPPRHDGRRQRQRRQQVRQDVACGSAMTGSGWIPICLLC